MQKSSGGSTVSTAMLAGHVPSPFFLSFMAEVTYLSKLEKSVIKLRNPDLIMMVKRQMILKSLLLI